jgi:hypothetical protein
MTMRPLRLYLALCALLPIIGHAQEDPTSAMTSSMDGSGKHFRGNLMINQASGSGQQQANARAIGFGDHSRAQIAVHQSSDALPSSGSQIDARASIDGGAFSRGSGMLGVNQSAGFANQQINAFRMAVSALPESVDDSDLAQSVAPVKYSGALNWPDGKRVVEMDDESFSASRGVVQLNQSAGVGNRTANNLSIRVLD